MTTLLLAAGIAALLALSFGFAIRVRRQAEALDPERTERRFGPEYDRVLARRNGDAKAARRELADRLRRYGSLTVLPLAPGARGNWLAQWEAVEEEFTESPADALGSAEDLLTRLAEERGYPVQVPFEERVAALSVHHARRVHGYLRVHEVRNGESSSASCASDPTSAAPTATHTPDVESLRTALLEARALFDSLLEARATHGRAQQRERATAAVAARPRPLLGPTGVPHRHPSAAARGTARGAH
jgi:hypothetical protein